MATIYGTSFWDFNLEGTEYDDVIYGYEGNDVLHGRGGSDHLIGGLGGDRMYGGSGDDFYYVDDALDTVSENVSDYTYVDAGGFDTIYTWRSADFLPAWVEVLEYMGAYPFYGIGNDFSNLISGGFSDDEIYGKAGDDFLLGSAGIDLLDGGAGADTLYGGVGNDTYLIDNSLDKAIEEVGEGTDLVKSSVTFTLQLNVENLTLTGSAAINGTGNGLANIITGNAAANLLSGGGGNDTLNGGAGADTMKGGSGNDTYIVSSSLDKVVEVAGEGSDLVKSSVSITLAANVEKLTLSGSAAINGTGNGLANTITGNAAANLLSGGGGNDTLQGGAGADTLDGGSGNDGVYGGSGTDTLTGGLGMDSFYFDSVLSASTNVDRIADFSVADDTIRLDDDVFKAAGAIGTLSGYAYFAGTAAHDASDRIIYDRASGNIYYDADGNGVGAQVLFATVTAGLLLTSSDFFIVA